MHGFTGNWTFYYKTGQQWQEGRWKDGIPTGEHIKWYPNGNTKTILTYVDGGLEGPITKYKLLKSDPFFKRYFTILTTIFL